MLMPVNQLQHLTLLSNLGLSTDCPLGICIVCATVLYMNLLATFQDPKLIHSNNSSHSASAVNVTCLLFNTS